MVAAEDVGHEIRAVSLQLRGRTHGLIRRPNRPAQVARGLNGLRLDVEHAVRVGRLRIGGQIRGPRIPRRSTRLEVLIVQEEPAEHLGKRRVEHEPITRNERVRCLMRRRAKRAPELLACLLLRRFFLRVGRRVACIAPLVVGAELVLEFVRGVQLVVEFDLLVLEDGLIVRQAILHIFEVGKRDGVGANQQRSSPLCIGIPHALGSRAIEEVDHTRVDGLFVHRRPPPQPVLHDRPAVLTRNVVDLLDRRARQEARCALCELRFGHVVVLHLVVFERAHHRSLEHVAAALGDQVDRQTRRLHRHVAAAVGHRDLVERIEIEVGRR